MEQPGNTADGCAVTARRLSEPLPGTAPVARGWICVEHPGPWGRDALDAGVLGRRVAGHLTDRTAGTDVRVQLIRRFGGGSTTTARCLLAHSGPGGGWLEEFDLSSVRDVRDLDPRVTLVDTPPELGRAVTDPAVLVCTHARRDACCARFGRPVAAALAGRFGPLVWETTHLGGHRFAANVAVLPAGVVLGGFEDTDRSVHAIGEHLAGRVDIAHLRGRSSLDRPAQAAEVFARTHSGYTALGDVEVSRLDGATDGTMRFAVSLDGRAHTVRLRREPTGVTRHLGCDKDAPEDPGRLRLLEVAAR